MLYKVDLYTIIVHAVRCFCNNALKQSDIHVYLSKGILDLTDWRLISGVAQWNKLESYEFLSRLAYAHQYVFKTLITNWHYLTQILAFLFTISKPQ